MTIESQDFASAQAAQEVSARSFAERARSLAARGSLVIALGLGAAACGEAAGDSGSHPSVTTLKTAGNLAPDSTINPCGDINLGENLASSSLPFDSPEAIVPKLYTTDQKTGQKELISPLQASEVVRKMVCGDTDVLAVFAALNELWQTEQLPSPGIVDRIKQLASNYSSNPEAAKTAEQNVFPWLSNLVPTTKFAVTKGQTTDLQFGRVDSAVVDIMAADDTPTTNLSGFEIGFLEDNTNLSDVQKAIYKKLQQLILINQNGQININNLIANVTEQLNNEQQNGSSTQSTNNPNSSSSTNNNQNNSNNNGSSSSGGKAANGSTQGNQGSGKNGTTSGGSTPEGAPGSNLPTPAKPTSGTQGTTPGSTPGTTPGTSPGTTPTTQETTVPPSTTPTTALSTTSTTGPVTTTTYNKPPVPTTLPVWGGQ